MITAASALVVLPMGLSVPSALPFTISFLTIAEIAARYGLTESKVKMQLSRTRGKLRTHLEQEGISV